jgi:ATP phosphoribosyltransferase
MREDGRLHLAIQKSGRLVGGQPLIASRCGMRLRPEVNRPLHASARNKPIVSC